MTQACAIDADGTPFTFRRGELLRGSHPATTRLGLDAVLPADTPPSEWPSEIDRAAELLDAELAAEAKSAPPPTPPRIDPWTPIGDLMICVRAVIDCSAGACKVDRIVHKSDPLVGAVPEAFAPLAERLGT